VTFNVVSVCYKLFQVQLMLVSLAVHLSFYPFTGSVTIIRSLKWIAVLFILKEITSNLSEVKREIEPWILGNYTLKCGEKINDGHSVDTRHACISVNMCTYLHYLSLLPPLWKKKWHGLWKYCSSWCAAIGIQLSNFRKFTGKYLCTLFEQWKRTFHVENLVCNICITLLTLRGHSMPSCMTDQPSLFKNSVIEGCPACKPVIYNCMQECDLVHSILLLFVCGQCSHMP